ncbi:MFS transporter [Streptomyces gilvifuscus]|uniref:MFS transporter n=1 Tax=Streptomyces gilvifuscus TaxID=1550617 RepID=A0ABT5FP92_9ACTN|nr:MFS transporter [Streptomyces gilvifuscus]MDC2954296.1 MFS transporter [Streptomyces gilvifuscus]
MRGGRSLGRRFEWLWAAYAASALGTWLAFDAFSLIAVIVLHAGATEVAVLSAAGPAVGAVVATPLGPWMEFRRKRPVMMAMDLVRCLVLLTVPAAYALDTLTFVQLLVVAVVVGAADIGFTAASGAFVKSLLPPEDLLAANARFEATQWTATILGPPLGGAAMGVFGPVTTVLANAVSFLLSAVGIRAIGGTETPPARTGPAPAGGLLEGWRYILAHPVLRPLFFNTALYNALIMVSVPLLAVLMVGDLGFSAWQYGLAFSVPSVGGLIGSRLARRLVPRFGERRVLLTSGWLRAFWPIGLAFVGPGTGGLVLVMAVELGVITSCAVFNPVYATTRLRQTDADRVARTLAAWSVTTKATTAAMTALWGLLAGVTGPRTAIAIAGVLVLATPLLLPRRIEAPPAPARLRAEEAA